MASRTDIESAVQSAKARLEADGTSCGVSADDLSRWFEADTLYPDISLDEVLANPWLVIHEIVEIDAIKKRGMKLTKDVIIKHPDEVDNAHYEAAVIELRIAAEEKDAKHLRERIPDIRHWSEDPQVQPEMKAKYARLCLDTERALKRIEEIE